MPEAVAVEGSHRFLGINKNGMREVETRCYCGGIHIWEADPGADEDFLKLFIPECELCARELKRLN